MYPNEEDNKWIAYVSLVIIFLIAVVLILVVYINSDPPKSVQYETPAYPSTSHNSGWSDTKKVLYSVIFKDHNITFYYGCQYDKGVVNLSNCDIPEQYKTKRGERVEAEHVVPASLLPAHNFPCWDKSKGGSRQKCEKEDPRAQAMIFDLHNLMPSVGEVNADRSNKRYGVGPDKFEPNDCIKGDVARVWLYMRLRHGVVFEPGEEEMFLGWAQQDPVSPWESEREKRVSKYTFISNPYIRGQKPDDAGSCPWEK